MWGSVERKSRREAVERWSFLESVTSLVDQSAGGLAEVDGGIVEVEEDDGVGDIGHEHGVGRSGAGKGAEEAGAFDADRRRGRGWRRTRYRRCRR